MKIFEGAEKLKKNFKLVLAMSGFVVLTSCSNPSALEKTTESTKIETTVEKTTEATTEAVTTVEPTTEEVTTVEPTTETQELTYIPHAELYASDEEYKNAYDNMMLEADGIIDDMYGKTRELEDSPNRIEDYREILPEIINFTRIYDYAEFGGDEDDVLKFEGLALYMYDMGFTLYQIPLFGEEAGAFFCAYDKIETKEEMMEALTALCLAKTGYASPNLEYFRDFYAHMKIDLYINVDEPEKNLEVDFLYKKGEVSDQINKNYCTTTSLIKEAEKYFLIYDEKILAKIFSKTR